MWRSAMSSVKVLYAIRLRCKTVYSQDVRCVIELIQNDVVRETVTICSTFDHTFENLSSDTIYDFRIQVSDVLNQTTFTYISQATKKYFINSFLATHQKLVSFGSVFEGVRFVTNMTNAKRIDIQLRTEMDIVLGAWNDVKFESTGMFIRIKDRLNHDGYDLGKRPDRPSLSGTQYTVMHVCVAHWKR